MAHICFNLKQNKGLIREENMKTLAMSLILLTLIANGLSMEDTKTSDEIMQMKCQLNTAYQSGDVKSISDIYLNYDKMPITEETFQQIKSNFLENSLYFYQWPGQKGKDTLGGWLFYPDFIEDWLDHPSIKDNLDSLPILLTCTYASRYNHALARFFVMRTLLNAYDRHDLSNNKYTFLESIRDHTTTTLAECKDHPYASYIMGRLHSDGQFMAYKGKGVGFNAETALAYHECHNDPRNNFWAVFIRDEYKVKRGKPTSLEISQALIGYPLGFFAMLPSLIANPSQIMGYLDRLVNHSCLKIEKLCRDFYITPSSTLKILEDLKEIGHTGIYIAYAELAAIIFDEIQEETFDLDNTVISIELIKETLQLLEESGNKGFYQAWMKLANYQELLKNHKESRLQFLYNKLSHRNYLRRAASLGDWQAYSSLKSYIVSSYGPPIGSNELTKNIYEFLTHT